MTAPHSDIAAPDSLLTAEQWAAAKDQAKAPAAIGPGSDRPFSWTCKNGKVIHLPSMAELDPDIGATADFAEAQTTGNEVLALGANLRFLSSGLPEDAAQSLRQLRASEFEAFVTAWSSHSGVTPGESSAS